MYGPKRGYRGATADSLAGGHTSQGVFLAAGPAIEHARIGGATLADLTPTALHLAGLSVPSDLDGRVLTGALDSGWLGAHPIRSGPPAGREVTEEASGYSAEEAAEVEEQLRALGYL